MKCPHCKKPIPKGIIAANQLIEYLEEDPWLLDIPELKPAFDRLRVYLSDIQVEYNSDVGCKAIISSERW